MIGDVLVDAGTRHARPRILRQLEDREISAHALTHAHFDHQGSSHAVCEQLGLPLLCPAAEADAMEGKADVLDLIPATRSRAGSHVTGRARPIRLLSDFARGDEVAGFQVLETPHSPGHVAFWRESDRVLVAEDVLNGMNLFTSLPGLNEPPKVFTVAPERNRESIRRLAELKPTLTVFGHGPPCRDPDKLAAFARKLPACRETGRLALALATCRHGSRHHAGHRELV